MDYQVLTKELQTVPSVYYEEIMSFIKYLKFKDSKELSQTNESLDEQRLDSYNALLQIIKPCPKDFCPEQELKNALSEKYGD